MFHEVHQYSNEQTNKAGYAQRIMTGEYHMKPKKDGPTPKPLSKTLGFF